MKRFLSLLSGLLLSMTCAQAQVGRVMPSEMQQWQDPVSGLRMTILTDTLKNDRNLYQTDPMWTVDGRWILFRSSSREETTSEDGRHRTQYYLLEAATGRIVQVTEGAQTGGAMLASKSNRLFVSRRIDGAWTLYDVDLAAILRDADRGIVQGSASYERKVGTVPAEFGRAEGFAVDCSDSYVYIVVQRKGTPEELARIERNTFRPDPTQPIKIKPVPGGIVKMNTTTGEVSKVVDVEFKVGHIQTNRFVEGEILFCNETGGDAHQRIWFVNADGTGLRPIYKETPLDWVTHETFSSRDYVYFNILGFQSRLRKQASGIMRINLRNDDVELLGQVELDEDRRGQADQIAGRGFWHCNATRDNKWATGDTFAGNIYIINTETGERKLIATGCRMKPDHAQPSFSPDGRWLLFQTGRFSNGKRLNLMMVDLQQVY